MCLFYSKYHTAKLRKELKTKGKITVYKYLVKNKTLKSFFYNYKWKIGENVSNREHHPWNDFKTYIDCGFHVYLDRKVAKEYASASEVIVKFTAKVEDFVAADKPHKEFTKAGCGKIFIAQEAVFSKLTLQKSTWEKIFAKK